jgi:streptogramin lyase
MKQNRLVIIFLVLICALALAHPVWADLLGEETPLTPGGQVYELNLDSQGILWISDASAGEIWGFNAESGAYTLYPVGGGPSDAHGDGAGAFWWADFTSNQLSRLSTGTNQITIWEVPDSTGLYTIALTSSGDVWVSDYYTANLYKLDPDQNQLCNYVIPNDGLSEYLLLENDQLWFGDYVNGRIMRLEGSTYNWWNLPADSYPRDLKVDGAGKVWWTDANQGYLGRLDPVADTVTTFTPPASGVPVMMSLINGKVWYTQQSPSRIVFLDPSLASGATTSVTTGSQSVNPTCDELLPLPVTSITPTSGTASWSDQIYPTQLSEPGWTIYQMPANGVPWGIVAADQIWLVDQNRQLLARFSLGSSIYLPVIIRG